MKFRNGVSLFSSYVNNDIILNGHYVSCETFVDDACIHVSSVFYETDLFKVLQLAADKVFKRKNLSNYKNATKASSL